MYAVRVHFIVNYLEMGWMGLGKAVRTFLSRPCLGRVGSSSPSNCADASSSRDTIVTYESVAPYRLRSEISVSVFVGIVADARSCFFRPSVPRSYCCFFPPPCLMLRCNVPSSP